jgi:hypothetical protein
METIASKGNFFSVRYDGSTGIVEAELIGFWGPEVLVDYVPAIQRAFALSRSQYGRAFALFDLVQSKTMSGEFFDRYRENGSDFVRPEDQVAIVLVSSLLKMQAKRLATTSAENSYFASRDEALAWLNGRRATLGAERR